jgi:hypothetical protein
MGGRAVLLFYIFVVIFVATAVVTLLGVVRVIDVPQTQLNVLVPAVLVGLAGAVFALFRRTNFFETPSTAASLGAGFEALDQISDEIKATIENKAVEQPPKAHSFLIVRIDDSVVAYRRMQVLEGADLDKLPKEERDRIRDYEKSMRTLVKEWSKSKRSGVSQLDPNVRDRQMQLLRAAKDDLVGILDFLQQRHMYLDDHYLEVRSLVANL